MEGHVNTSSRLEALRKAMKEHDVDIYIVPSEDSHSSEYTATCHARREFISGFTGSAGCAIISLDKAVLSTDGRYFNQASKQLDSNWTLLKQGIQDVPTWQEWTAEEATGGKVVAVDPTLLPTSIAKKLAEKVKKTSGTDLLPLRKNLVDVVWGDARPALPSSIIKALPERFAGKSVSAKLASLREELEKRKSAGIVISMLDEIAWLFNLRGADISYCPIFFSYAIVTPDSAILYVDEARLSADVRPGLEKSNVQVKAYDSFFLDCARLAPQPESGSDSVPSATPLNYLICNKASWALKLALGGDKNVDEIRSPVGDAKAIKNPTELDGMRQCHIRDGAALIGYFAWLEHELTVKHSTIDEVTAADKLEEFRKKQDMFVGLSFDTISSTGPNGAIIHYSPQRNNCAVIDPNSIYLCDSGAQYLDGTTDTTRTLHFGVPSDFERKAYTLVLKGNIALDMAIFPKGTSGFALDAMARQFLWKEGLDYRHGTGHGVGSYLNVHEGPIGIGTRVQYAEVALAPGNVISNEPGYYEDGSFGIRIENMVIVREIKTKHSFGDKPYLGFEHVTMVPYCRKLIDTGLLTEAEKSWINESHADIHEKMKERFENDPIALEWLKRETAPLV
ncbi:putative Xaa-Pro aminopeptidase P [Ceratocystis fimbriata CBS 114723]|uniref:Probable Xaa-Pro aminopeptidase P n=1 Tax=Ceratocystis fimbriata CBS 114723 TaxID=1035309 RepID=A0A2C5WUY2_9PEZI|nr:putative Xaa-Pro aminopeptidase P [Ceratocystis fimbriata CBS 114723]